MKWCAQTFLPIFGLFIIFDRNFPKIVALPSNEMRASPSERAITSEKRWKLHQNRPTNRDTIVPQTMSPLMKSTPALECDRQKKIKKNPLKRDNAYRQDIVTHICCHTGVELTIISIVTLRSIWHNYAANFFLRFGKFPPQICKSCGAIYWCKCEMFGALQSKSGPITDGEYTVQIDA